MGYDWGNVDRRRFLALAGAGGLGLVGGLTGFAQAASGATSATVWQLDRDWGYPRGPYGKTRLVSRASRRAAQNRIALSEQQALDTNLHPCSFAPAVAHTVCAATLAALWDDRSYEWTNPWNGTVVRVLDRRHLSAAEAARLDGACTPTPGDSVLLRADGRAGDSAANDSVDPRATLPNTGVGPSRLVAAGIAAVFGGVIAIRRSEHHAAGPSERGPQR